MDYETLSVNELVDRISVFHTKPVAVVGLLTFDFEDQSISHFPKAEQREPGHGSGLALYPSSVWLAFGGTGSLRPNERVLSRWNRKRVRVLGIAHGSLHAESGYMGCGHMGGWPCEIDVYSIERM